MHFTSVDEAMQYIAERYVFNGTNYPILKKLDPLEAKVFSVNHNLLHMQKGIYKLLCDIEELMFTGTVEDMAVLKEVCVKTITNTLRLAELLQVNNLPSGLNNNLKENLNPMEFLLFLSLLAELCEKFDHTGQFGDFENKAASECVRGMWSRLLVLPKLEGFPWQFAELVEEIPTYMKSK